LLAALVRSRAGQGGPLRELFRERLAERFGDAGDEDDDGMAVDASAAMFTPPPGMVLEPDLAYGDDPAQVLDLYRPTIAVAGAALIVLVHGGGWRRGDKAGPRLVQNKVLHWVGQGHVLVSLNYRLLPDADPLEQADDIGLALAFAQNHAERWGADTERCVLVGHSAGAHLVSLLSADPSLAIDQGARPWHATVAIDSAALDIEAIMNGRHFGLYDIAFGNDPDFWRRASPMHRLQSRPAAPMLLVCSARRDDVCAAAQTFADKAAGFGGDVTVLPVELNHLQINEQLGVPGTYTDAVDAFLRRAARR
jgi:arylformamidase